MDNLGIRHDLIIRISGVDIPGKEGAWYLTNIMKRNDKVYLCWESEDALYELRDDTKAKPFVQVTTDKDRAVITDIPWGSSEWESFLDEMDPIIEEIEEKPVQSLTGRLTKAGRDLFSRFSGEQAEAATYVRAERPESLECDDDSDEIER
jgi:hypothetical protein